jgi:S-adenosylmethionine:tRNA ribosyltransferase-isomerase
MADMMETREFEYFLPPELIAQYPIEPRDSSRLLVLKRDQKTVGEDVFRNLINYLNPGDVLVLNDTRVIPARLPARKTSGGKVEVFLLQDLGGGRWEALVKPGAKLPVGEEIWVAGEIPAKILERTAEGGRIIQFPSSQLGESALRSFGQVPLPPYIKQPLSDPARYQTVYAERDGSVAAPTAALHFTPELLRRIEAKGVEIVYITLHMGLGSFRPIKEERLEQHRMPTEYYRVSESVAEKVNAAKEKGHRVVACGTDAVRTLETAADTVRWPCPHQRNSGGRLQPGEGTTGLFITPGYRFKVVDVLITNLHLPRSSHLVLVSAFAGKEFVFKAYRYATDKGFRFYSFGDATIVI